MKLLESAAQWVASMVRIGWRRVRDLSGRGAYLPPPVRVVESGRMDFGANYAWVVWGPERPPSQVRPSSPERPGVTEPGLDRPLPSEVLNQLRLVSDCGAVLVATLRDSEGARAPAGLMVTPACLRVSLLDPPRRP